MLDRSNGVACRSVGSMEFTPRGKFVVPLLRLDVCDKRFQVIVTHTFGIDEAPEAYRIFDTGKTGKCAILYQGERQVHQVT